MCDGSRSLRERHLRMSSRERHADHRPAAGNPARRRRIERLIEGLRPRRASLPTFVRTSSSARSPSVCATTRSSGAVRPSRPGPVSAMRRLLPPTPSGAWSTARSRLSRPGRRGLRARHAHRRVERRARPGSGPDRRSGDDHRRPRGAEGVGPARCPPDQVDELTAELGEDRRRSPSCAALSASARSSSRPPVRGGRPPRRIDALSTALPATRAFDTCKPRLSSNRSPPGAEIAAGVDRIAASRRRSRPWGGPIRPRRGRQQPR